MTRKYVFVRKATFTNRKGVLLEGTVARIFSSAGFEVKRNAWVKGVHQSYEVDVIVRHNGLTIIVECKQYEKAKSTVRNWIHQWADKNRDIKADRVVLVIYGIEVSYEDGNLATDRGILIWDDHTVEDYSDAIAEGKNIKDLIIKDLGLSNTESRTETKEKQRVWYLLTSSERRKYIFLLVVFSIIICALFSYSAVAFWITLISGLLIPWFKRK